MELRELIPDISFIQLIYLDYLDCLTCNATATYATVLMKKCTKVEKSLHSIIMGLFIAPYTFVHFQPTFDI